MVVPYAYEKADWHKIGRRGLKGSLKIAHGSKKKDEEGLEK